MSKEIFHKVRTHLLTQLERSATSSGFCMYRGPNNLKCAVGCLIQDNEYEESMENVCAENLSFGFPQLQHLAQHAEILEKLQKIHDTCYPQDWEAKLDRLQEEYGY